MSDPIDNEDIKVHKVKALLGEPRALAKQRLMDFAETLSGTSDYDEEPSPVTYQELIDRATRFQETGDYWSEGGRFEGMGIYKTFWDDYALVTNLPVNDTYSFFSCSC